MVPDALLDLIRKFEGLRLRAYLCPAGIPTIGYGHTGADVTIGMAPITVAQAEAEMLLDADRFVRAALAMSPILHDNPDRLAAIADFCYNLGTTRYKASTLKRRVDAADWDGAADELQKWVWGGGRKLPGLVMRRAAEASLLR